MKKQYFTLFILWSTTTIMLKAQDNCNVFLWNGDSCKYKACEFIQSSPGYFQLTREFHEIFDEAMEMCPEYSHPYRAKSVSYLKTGDFINWKILIDKAVELDPIKYLNYRGWCRFQFFRDYKGAIEDIEQLSKLIDYDIGYSQNGTYHLNIAKGLCYKMAGDSEKAIQIIENQIFKDTAQVGFYDYFHLGVLYLETGKLQQAVATFEQQEKVYDLAENQYYKGLAYKALDDKQHQLSCMKRAKELYQNSKTMYDPYSHQIDKIYLSEIEKELKNMEGVNN